LHPNCAFRLPDDRFRVLDVRLLDEYGLLNSRKSRSKNPARGKPDGRFGRAVQKQISAEISEDQGTI
jgi:hypothetical protein